MTLSTSIPSLAEMTEALERLVSSESPSTEVAALERCAGELARLGEALLGRAAEIVRNEDAIPHLLWRFGATPRVLLLAHYDTVWPLGTITQRPFAVRDGRAYGPGVYDMKAGIVQGLYALSQLEERDGVVLLVTGDEETGSVSSRSLIEETAKSCGAVLVLEPGNSNGALVTGRRGSQTFRLTLTGRRAHAAEPHHTDENTLVALAEAILDAGALASTMQGVSITPTMVSAGDAVNVIPEKAELILDVRVSDAGQLERMGALLSSLPHSLSGGSFSVAAVDEARPPLEARHAAALFELACRVARQLELPALEQCDGLGATDGNFTAACGTATLDGLGPVGDGAHRVDEFVELAAMPERAALIRGIVAELLLPRE